MDNIIARQKIGKRRPAPKSIDSTAAYSYRPESVIPLGRSATRLESQPRRKSRAPRQAASWAATEARLRDTTGFGRALPSLARWVARLFANSKLPGTSLALIGAAVLAAILALALGLAALLRGPAFPLPPGGLLPSEDSAQNLLQDYISPELATAGDGSDLDAATLPPAPVTLELSTYTVRAGDSLASIAKRFGLYVDTLISANGISSSSAIKPGASLRIPNINGLVHRTRPGDNLASIAKRYKTDTTKIVDANDLGSSRILSGQSIFIPGARLPEAAVKQALGQRVAWPLRGPLSSFFGYRDDPFTGVRRFHAGIDIVTNSGTPVRAAMDGRVSDSGYNANYGNYIILNHAEGYQTLYGHLSAGLAALGSKVSQGSVIGLSGNTGYSTGPHLHFGLFRHGLPVNPLKYVK